MDILYFTFLKDVIQTIPCVVEMYGTHSELENIENTSKLKHLGSIMLGIN